MTFLSICSGIEAASVAWHPLGWRAVAFAEIEPFPSAVLAHRWPGVPNLGDLSKHHDWSVQHSLVVGGTPCQAFSVAGLRRGLADPRGNLTLVFVGLLERTRPRWVVWENVPGVLSIDGGRAFGAFLGGLGELGYGFAYRVLDAQHFGVPQRRRRVFVVGHLGDWRRAAAVLFEPACLRGDPAKGEGARETTPTLTARGTDGGRVGNDFDCGGGLIPVVAPTLDARAGRSGETTFHTSGGLIPATFPTLDASMGTKTGCNQWVDGGYAVLSSGQANAEIMTDGRCPALTCLHEAPIVAHTLRADGFDASEDGTGRGTPLVAFHPTQDPSSSESTCHALGCGSRNGSAGAALASTQGVRRVTPRECERLQGFPDDYTRIPWRGRPAEQCPDGPRYKALGNSMAVPVMRWIGRRIHSLENP